jgi:hypothetical protein
MDNTGGLGIQVAGRFVGQMTKREVDQGSGYATRCCSPPESS